MTPKPWWLTLNRPNNKTVLTVLITLAAWALIGWILYSLRNLTGEAQIEASTRMLRIVCAGASLLLLMACMVLGLGLLQIARDTEAEHRFPPTSTQPFKLIGSAEGEQAWLVAARLRGWAALVLASGLLIAALGIGMALRQTPLLPAPMPSLQAPAISERGLVADRQSVHRPIPTLSKSAPG